LGANSGPGGGASRRGGSRWLGRARIITRQKSKKVRGKRKTREKLGPEADKKNTKETRGGSGLQSGGPGRNCWRSAPQEEKGLSLMELQLWDRRGHLSIPQSGQKAFRLPLGRANGERQGDKRAHVGKGKGKHSRREAFGLEKKPDEGNVKTPSSGQEKSWV